MHLVDLLSSIVSQKYVDNKPESDIHETKPATLLYAEQQKNAKMLTFQSAK